MLIQLLNSLRTERVYGWHKLNQLTLPDKCNPVRNVEVQLPFANPRDGRVDVFTNIAREYKPPDDFQQSPKQRGAHFGQGFCHPLRRGGYVKIEALRAPGFRHHIRRERHVSGDRPCLE